MAKNKLPKYIRKKGPGYEARTSIEGETIYAYDKDLDACIEKFEKAKLNAKANRKKLYTSFTVNEWFEEWFELVKKHSLKDTSWYPVTHTFKKTFGFYMGSMKVTEITPMDVQCAVNAMESVQMPQKTMREGLGTLRSCLDFAIANGIITTNPTLAIELPWCFKMATEGIALTQQEQDIFLDAAEDSWYKELFYCMFATGMRVGEIGGLRWSDIDFEKKEFFIQRALCCNYKDGIKTIKMIPPKTTNSVRKIPFMGGIEMMLLSLKKKQRDRKKELRERWREEGEMTDLVFTTSMGSPCTRYIVEKEVKKVLKRIRDKEAYQCAIENREAIKFPEMYPHAIRHTFATRCFERGMSPKVVQRLMGHATISITLDIYTHILSERIMDETKKFGAINTGSAREETEVFNPLDNVVTISEEELYKYGIGPTYSGLNEVPMKFATEYELLMNVLRLDEMCSSKQISQNCIADIKACFRVTQVEAAAILNKWYIMLDNGNVMGQLVQNLSEEEKDAILILLGDKKEEENNILKNGTLHERIGAEFNLKIIESLEEKLSKGSQFYAAV